MEHTIIQANDLIKQMNVEVRSSDPSTRRNLTEKINQYQKTMVAHKSDFEQAKDANQRSQLIGDKSSAHRQRLLDTNDKLARQNEVILAASRTVAETEEVGIEITNELIRNREKIQSAHAKTRDFIGITDSARRLITSMQRRDVQQRFILAFIAVVLIIAISITVYFTQSKSKSKK